MRDEDGRSPHDQGDTPAEEASSGRGDAVDDAPTDGRADDRTETVDESTSTAGGSIPTDGSTTGTELDSADREHSHAGDAESDRRAENRPRPQPGTRAADDDVGFITRFRTAQSGPLLFIRETLYSGLAVVAVGLLLFAISGVWPPMVAVESGSMEPEMYRGDLIFVTEEHRFTPEYAYGDTGVVTVEIGTEEGYRSLGGSGSVIIYDPPGRVGSPIIHRAHFHVEDGENWYDRANPAYMRADDCEELPNCPAPHAGFITKGDANGQYDQVTDIADTAGPVRPEWIRGSARLRIPYLGHVRLRLAGMFAG